MDFLKIKFFVLFIAFAISAFIAPSGIIVMEDDIMRVETGKSEELVTSVKIFNSTGALIYQNSGCGASVCSYNLSHLEDGTYTSTVSTSGTHSFTQQITK